MTDSFNFSINMSGLSSVKLKNVSETCEELKDNKIFNHLFENQKWLNKNQSSDEFLTGDEIKTFIGGKDGVRDALSSDGTITEDEFNSWKQSNIDSGNTAHEKFSWEDMKEFLGIVADIAKGEREYKDSSDDLVTGKTYFSKYGAVTGESEYEYNGKDQITKETVNMFDGSENYVKDYFYDTSNKLDWTGTKYESNTSGHYDIKHAYKHTRYNSYIWQESINTDFTNDFFETVYEYNSSGRKVDRNYLDID